jgi:methylenetetrahydrofolate reductase (NADPH)
MRIADLLERQRPVFSFEFFPPKTDEGQQTLRNTLDVLKDDQPDYVSVTYGAGGTTRNRTVEITKSIKQDLGIEAMAHLSCVGEPAEGLVEILGEIDSSGIENVLALRGDPPRGESEWTPHPGGLTYSIDLIRLIRERFDFCVGAACFPEIHPDAPDRASDLRYAREKTEAGAGFLITQLFFDNDSYFAYVEEARAAGIDVPIIPGIMPITN